MLYGVQKLFDNELDVAINGTSPQVAMLCGDKCVDIA